MGGAAEGLISPLRVCEPGTPCRCHSVPAVCHAGTFCGHRCPCQAVPCTSPSRESPSEAKSSMWSFVPKQAHALPASPGHMDFPISSCFVSSELRRRLLAGGHWAKEKRRHGFPACVSFIEGVATQQVGTASSTWFYLATQVGPHGSTEAPAEMVPPLLGGIESYWQGEKIRLSSGELQVGIQRKRDSSNLL